MLKLLPLLQSSQVVLYQSMKSYLSGLLSKIGLDSASLNAAGFLFYSDCWRLISCHNTPTSRILSKSAVVESIFLQGGDQGVTDRCSKRVGLELILVHDPVPFGVYPGLSKHTRPQLIVFIVAAFMPNYGLVVFGIQFVLGWLEISQVSARVFEI